MASNLTEDISCPVCKDIYKDPVILTCSHSFCKACIQQCWETNTARECPVCRRKSSKDFLLPNLALRKLCETVCKFSLQDRETTTEHKSKPEVCQEDKHHSLSPGDTAFELKTMDEEQVCNTLLKKSGEHTWEQAVSRAKEEATLDNVVLNIAVTGMSGAGKSSFVNAIRGLKHRDVGAAPVDETECTKEPMKYSHPTMPNVNFWDLPGIGTSAFSASDYTKKVNLQTYDFFIIVSATRFTENDIKLVKEIKKNNKNFYFVRSKIDIDVTNAKGQSQTEEETLKKIRDDCEKNLTKLGSPSVFLIASNNLNTFDFKDLVDALEKDLPEKKRKALVQSLPVYSQECLEKKYRAFRYSAWYVALVSGGIAVVPVPGLSTACDVAMLLSFFTTCYHSFGLDDRSLTKLEESVNKPIKDKVKKSEFIEALANKTLVTTTLTGIGVSGVLETACIFLPSVGNVAAAGVSFATTYTALRAGLIDLYNLAKEVIEMAGLQ